MVYRCGGATLDVSIVIVRGGMYKVVCSVHRKQGGDRFTALVSNFLANEFQKYQQNVSFFHSRFNRLFLKLANGNWTQERAKGPSSN